NFRLSFLAVFFGHVEVEENQAGARRILRLFEAAAAHQVIEQFLAVLDKAQCPLPAAFRDRILDKQSIVRIIFGHEDNVAFGKFFHQAVLSGLAWRTGKSIMKVAPWPGALLAVIVPLWRSAMRRQTARPTPVPSY